MSGRPSRESVMTALLNALIASVQASFTADTQAGSTILTNQSATSGLSLGLPVFGGSIPRGAIIANLSPLTLSLPAGINAVGVPLNTGFQTFGRRFIPWNQVSAQPA